MVPKNIEKPKKNTRPPSTIKSEKKKLYTVSKSNSKNIIKKSDSTRNLKSIDKNKSMKTLESNLEKDDIDFVELLPEKYSVRNEKVNNSFKNETKIPEIKITPNISMINKLINNSNDIVNEQKNILENFSEVNKKLTSSEYDIQRLTSKLENDEFSHFAGKYSNCLNQVLENLKTHSEEVENIKCK